jgi:hypothetical protein
MSEESDNTNEQSEATKNNTAETNKNNAAKKTEADLLKELIDLKKTDNETSTRRAMIDADYLARAGQKNAARKAYIAQLKQLDETQASYAMSTARITELQEKGTAATIEETQELAKLEKELAGIAKKAEEAAKHKDKLTESLKKLGEISAKDQPTVEALTKGIGSMTMGLISATSGADHMITKFGQMILEVSQADNIMQVLTESFGSVFTLTNIAASAFDTIKNATMDMATQFDAAAASFSKTTGLAREYSNQLYAVSRAGNQFGVTAAEGGDAMAGLIANFSDFHKTAPAAQADLALNVAQLSKFGVSAGESAKLLQIFTKTMNMSGKEAIETTKKIGMMGTKLGISTSKMLKDYTASLSVLSVYGDKSIDVFTGIAAAAKTAGVETSVLLNLAEKFDTFSGAADTTAKLNSILGSQLSATEMLLMTEDERIKTLIATTQATGQSFASMDKFTQKAIANAAGITDMAEANKIFGMSMSEYESHDAQMSQASKVQEKFEEALQSTVPLQEKIKLLANEFAAVFVPALTGATYVIEGLIKAVRFLDEYSYGYFTTIAGGLAAVYMLNKALGVTTFISKANLVLKGKEKIASLFTKADKITETTLTTQQAAAEMRLQAVQRSKIKTQTLATQATRSAVGPMLALGAAVAMIGGGIYLAATGLAEFIKAFAGLTGPQLLAASFGLVVFTIAFGVLMAALIALVAGPQAIATAAAVGILLSVGAAALLIGAGINLAATGMATFIDSLSGLADVAEVMDSFSGVKDIGMSIILNKNIQSVRDFMKDLSNSDVKAELENIALITTGTSATLMTDNAVSNLIAVSTLADQIKNIFNADITIKIDGEALGKLIENGVYKTSMGNT